MKGGEAKERYMQGHHSLVLVADLSEGARVDRSSDPPILEGCQASTLEDPLGESAEMILPES